LSNPKIRTTQILKTSSFARFWKLKNTFNFERSFPLGIMNATREEALHLLFYLLILVYIDLKRLDHLDDHFS